MDLRAVDDHRLSRRQSALWLAGAAALAWIAICVLCWAIGL